MILMTLCRNKKDNYDKSENQILYVLFNKDYIIALAGI